MFSKSYLKEEQITKTDIASQLKRPELIKQKNYQTLKNKNWELLKPAFEAFSSLHVQLDSPMLRYFHSRPFEIIDMDFYFHFD